MCSGGDMTTVIDTLAVHRAVPVIKIDDAAVARPLAETLVNAGLPIAEVTFRTDCAAEAIAIMARQPGLLTGAGSLVSEEQAKRACDAGARFLVSAGISRPVIEFALRNNVPVFPGFCTPSELIVLIEYGLTAAKFFPAQNYGGVGTLKALSGPFPSMRYMPTGGISAANLREYLSFSKVFACGGSWMLGENLLAAGDFAAIDALVRQTVALTQG